MKKAKKIFGVLFIIIYLFYGGSVFFRGLPSMLNSLTMRFPNATWFTYDANVNGVYAMPVRNDLLELHGQIQNIFGKRENGGFDIIKGEDGAFIKNIRNDWNDRDLEMIAMELYDIKTALEEADLDTKVIFISPASQMIYEHSKTINNFPIYDQNNLMESLIYNLMRYDVDYFDIGMALRKTNLDTSYYTYKTDTAMTSNASFITYQSLVNELQYTYGEKIDTDNLLTDTNRFELKLYEDIFMGSLAMQTGVTYTGQEDFMTILPDFETDFTYEAYGIENVLETGSFQEVLFDESLLNPEDPYLSGTFAAYLHGGMYYQRKITNNNSDNGLKVLFIHDSYALPVIAFSSLCFDETHTYWPGSAPSDSEFQLLDYIEENQIDYVFFSSENYYYALTALFN